MDSYVLYAEDACVVILRRKEDGDIRLVFPRRVVHAKDCDAAEQFARVIAEYRLRYRDGTARGERAWADVAQAIFHIAAAFGRCVQVNSPREKDELLGVAADMSAQAVPEWML